MHSVLSHSDSSRRSVTFIRPSYRYSYRELGGGNQNKRVLQNQSVRNRQMNQKLKSSKIKEKWERKQNESEYKNQREKLEEAENQIENKSKIWWQSQRESKKCREHKLHNKWGGKTVKEETGERESMWDNQWMRRRKRTVHNSSERSGEGVTGQSLQSVTVAAQTQVTVTKRWAHSTHSRKIIKNMKLGRFFVSSQHWDTENWTISLCVFVFKWEPTYAGMCCNYAA